MSSLAKQLQRLAVAHTQSILGDDRSKKSLLFDPKEAATIDRETFYAIGINGLQELMTLNDAFEEFESSLFSLSSQSFERSVQSKEANAKLDVVLERFLLLLSPYLLLSPAQKCIEWLVHRYHIHWYNVDLIMMCILPYHETNIFVRMIQLLKLNPPTSKWHWLLPLQKSGTQLNRATLINHCHKNGGFFLFICDLVQRYIKVHQPQGPETPHLRPCLSLYTSTICGFLQQETVTEETVAMLKPFLGRGLESPLRDYKCATYMIITQLCRRVHINDDITHLLLSLMLKRYSLPLLPECLLCVLSIYQTQYINILPKKAFKYMMRMPNLCPVLVPLLRQFECRSFIDALLAKLIPLTVRRCARTGASSSDVSDSEQASHKPNYVALLNDILSLDLFDETTSQKITREILENCLLYMDMVDLDELYANIRPIMTTLDTRFSEGLSSVVEDMKERCSKGEGRHLTQFLSVVMAGSRFDAIADGDTGLIISLHHSQPYMRVQALDHLFSNINHYIETDHELLERSIVERLQDDEESVVMAVLKHNEVLWQCVKDENVLIGCLKRLLVKADTNQWVAVRDAAVNTLCHTPVNFDPILQYILPYMVSHNGVAMTILHSRLADQHPMTKGYKLRWLSLLMKDNSAKQMSDFMDQVISDIAKSYAALDPQSVISEIKAMLSTSDEHIKKYRQTYRALVCGVINELIQTLIGKQQDFITQLLPTHMALINSLLQSSETRGEALLFTEVLVLHLTIPKDIQSDWWYTGESSNDITAKTLVGVFDWLSRNASHGNTHSTDFRKYMNQFMKHFATPRDLLSFLAVMATGHLTHTATFVDPTLQAVSLVTLATVIDKLDADTLRDILATPTPVLSTILVALTHSIPDIREMALRVVSSVLQKAPTTPFTAMLTQIQECSEEIVADGDYISQVLCEVSSHITAPTKTKRRWSSTPPSPIEQLWATVTDHHTPPHVALCLLDVLKLVNTEESQKQLVPYLSQLLSTDVQSLKRVHREIMHCLLRRYTDDIAVTLHESSEGLQALCKACVCHTPSTQGVDSVANVAIKQVTKQFYSHLPSQDSRQILLHSLIDVLVTCDSLDTIEVIKCVIKRISVTAAHLTPQLTSILDTPVAATVRDAKRFNRTTTGESGNETSLDAAPWQRIIQILEVFHAKKKITDTHLLISPCFELLTKVLSIEKGGNGEYLKQLLLSTLYATMGKLSESDTGMVKALELTEDCKQRRFNGIVGDTITSALRFLKSLETRWPWHLRVVIIERTEDRFMTDTQVCSKKMDTCPYMLLSNVSALPDDLRQFHKRDLGICTDLLAPNLVEETQTDPGMDQTDPGTDHSDPGTDQTDPGTDQRDPRTDQPDSGTDQTDSGTDQTDPGTDQIDPGTDQTDPGTDQPDQDTEGGSPGEVPDKTDAGNIVTSDAQKVCFVMVLAMIVRTF